MKKLPSQCPNTFKYYLSILNVLPNESDLESFLEKITLSENEATDKEIKIEYKNFVKKLDKTLQNYIIENSNNRWFYMNPIISELLQDKQCLVMIAETIQLEKRYKDYWKNFTNGSRRISIIVDTISPNGAKPAKNQRDLESIKNDFIENINNWRTSLPFPYKNQTDLNHRLFMSFYKGKKGFSFPQINEKRLLTLQHTGLASIIRENEIEIDRIGLCLNCSKLFWRERIGKKREENILCSKCKNNLRQKIYQLRKKEEVLHKEKEKLEKLRTQKFYSNLLTEQEKKVLKLEKSIRKIEEKFNS